LKKNILILTAIKPDKNNFGGPSGLIWECVRVLKESNFYDINISIIQVNSKLNKLGIYHKYLDEDLGNFDEVFVYPFNLFFYINPLYRNKTYVLGPDSPSLLFTRFYKNSENYKNKFRNFILKHWFIYQEKKLLNSCKKYFVVGNNDSRWLKNINYDNKQKIKYLTHPILTSIIEDKYISDNPLLNENALIFAGDMSEKYTGKYVKEIGSILEEINLPIIIVGKNNRWIYEYFLNFNKKNITYIEWIENYNSICNPKYHIHIIPLINGAGTKNRTLTACAKGVNIISTNIGLENIIYNKLPINRIFKYKFSKDLIHIINNILFEEEIDNQELFYYTCRVNSKFSDELLSNMENNNEKYYT
jgi:hypothetical protein